MQYIGIQLMHEEQAWLPDMMHSNMLEITNNNQSINLITHL